MYVCICHAALCAKACITCVGVFRDLIRALRANVRITCVDGGSIIKGLRAKLMIASGAEKL